MYTGFTVTIILTTFPIQVKQIIQAKKNAYTQKNVILGTKK